MAAELPEVDTSFMEDIQKGEEHSIVQDLTMETIEDMETTILQGTSVSRASNTGGPSFGIFGANIMKILGVAPASR